MADMGNCRSFYEDVSSIFWPSSFPSGLLPIQKSLVPVYKR